MRWRNTVSLSTQFLIASAVVLCVSMAVLGTWVSHQIKRSVMATSSADSAAFIRATLEPYAQRIDSRGQLHPEDFAALDRLFIDTVLGERIISVKLWSTDGSANARIIYSSMAKETVGDEHVSTDVQEAWNGEPVTEFKDLAGGESQYEESLHIPLIEVYAPLFRTGTKEVIAVGEIYHAGSVLAQNLRQGVILTWMVVCLTTLLMIVVLYLIVRRANRLLLEQRSALSSKVQEAEEMAAQNHALRLAADRSRLDANEANEELLGRIGLDIHDGPIQFLTLVRFRMDEIAQRLSEGAHNAGSAASGLEELGSKVSSIIDELRDISVGLVLPELSRLSLLETIKLAVERHEHQTGTRVRLKHAGIPRKVPDPLKTCIYRIVQETLSNSFKHAGGHGQRITASAADGALTLEISDDGLPATATRSPKTGSRLGQRGIRNRVAAFNGTVTIEPHAEQGTRVRVSIPLELQRSL
jgi:signal transduction histidine kinase